MSSRELVEASFGKLAVIESGDVDHDDVNVAGSFEFKGGVEPSSFASCEILHARAKLRCTSVHKDKVLQCGVVDAGAERCGGLLVQRVSGEPTIFDPR